MNDRKFLAEMILAVFAFIGLITICAMIADVFGLYG